MKILMVFGTRPEAIKMCPLVLEMVEYPEIDCKVCVTGQHREMLSQVMNSFGVEPDYNLNIMTEGQTLTDITTSVLNGMKRVFSEYNPQLVLVHGDTTTAFASALAAFYEGIPVGHVESGLRTETIHSPFPEEMNRRVVDQLSEIRFAPTELNRSNLQREGITQNVYVTGNTIIDSFKYTVRDGYVYKNPILNMMDFSRRCSLVTAHRRENIGAPLINICKAVKKLSKEYPEDIFIFPVHPNPLVRETVYGVLDGIKNVFLTPPIDVFDMHNLLPQCHIVLTDSGGLQEEAPHFGIPVLVMRKETERLEAIEAGTVKLVGIEEDEIYRFASELLENLEEYERMSHCVNPYGDGHSSERIVNICIDFLNS